MFRLPRTLNFGLGYRVKVTLVTPQELELRLEGDGDADGYWDVDKMEICLRTGLTRKAMRVAYAHEVEHAAVDFARLVSLGSFPGRATPTH